MDFPKGRCIDCEHHSVNSLTTDDVCEATEPTVRLTDDQMYTPSECSEFTPK